MPSDPKLSPISRAEILRSLRGKINAIQGFKTSFDESSLSFGVPEIDRLLPGESLPLGTTHEFLADTPETIAATMNFIAAIMSKMENHTGGFIWVTKLQTFFAPGLLSFGIDPKRVTAVNVRDEKQALWAIEEALRSNRLNAVIGEISNASFNDTRRLQLAVEKSHGTGFLIRVKPKAPQVSACATRWIIKPLPTEERDKLPGIGSHRWNVELVKIKNRGELGSWEVEWNKPDFSIVNGRGGIQPQTIQRAGFSVA